MPADGERGIYIQRQPHIHTGGSRSWRPGRKVLTGSPLILLNLLCNYSVQMKMILDSETCTRRTRDCTCIADFIVRIGVESARHYRISQSYSNKRMCGPLQLNIHMSLIIQHRTCHFDSSKYSHTSL